MISKSQQKEIEGGHFGPRSGSLAKVTGWNPAARGEPSPRPRGPRSRPFCDVRFSRKFSSDSLPTLNPGTVQYSLPTLNPGTVFKLKLVHLLRYSSAFPRTRRSQDATERSWFKVSRFCCTSMKYSCDRRAWLATWGTRLSYSRGCSLVAGCCTGVRS